MLSPQMAAELLLRPKTPALLGPIRLAPRPTLLELPFDTPCTPLKPVPLIASLLLLVTVSGPATSTGPTNRPAKPVLVFSP